MRLFTPTRIRASLVTLLPFCNVQRSSFAISLRGNTGARIADQGGSLHQHSMGYGSLLIRASDPGCDVYKLTIIPVNMGYSSL